TKPRNVNLIEVFTDDEEEEEEETSEVYSNKEMNLRTRIINSTEIEIEFTPKQKSVKRARNPSRIDNFAPYNIADDILSKQSSATLGQWLQIPAQRRNLANALRRHLISTPS
ncbi:15853_t:CDS:2, partial [Funneliformis mosseae]